MADVTVLGAGGATVTISLTSAQNAAAAQKAVDVINAVTKTGLLEMQVSTGAGSLPAPQNFLAGAIFSGTGSSGASGDQYLFFGANGTGDNTVAGGANFRTVVVAGNGADLTYANSSRDGLVWFGKNKGTVANFEGKVTIETEDGEYTLVSDAGSSAVMNLASGAIAFVGGLEDSEGKSSIGNATINASGNSSVLMFGAATAPATTINMQGDGAVYLDGSASALINPGSHNVTVIGFDDNNGASTLFGGSGSHLVVDAAGMFIGGSAGGNQMYSSTVAGSATLRAGSSASTASDFLAAAGSGQTLDAGAGNVLMAATKVFDATGGSTFIVAAKATVTGYELGGNTFRISGNADGSSFDGGDAAAEGDRVGNQYFDLGTTASNIFVRDFFTGLDTFQVMGDFTVNYFSAETLGGDEELTVLQVTGGATYLFFDATPDGQDIFESDVTKITG